MSYEAFWGHLDIHYNTPEPLCLGYSVSEKYISAASRPRGWERLVMTLVLLSHRHSHYLCMASLGQRRSLVTQRYLSLEAAAVNTSDGQSSSA